MFDQEELLAMADVAFCNQMEHREKRSFKKTIDMVMGVYTRPGRYNGWLAISLKPTSGLKDWLINLLCFGNIHLGYRLEFEAYFSDIFRMVLARPQEAQKGIIVSGRSKGGAEAIMLATYLFAAGYKLFAGAVEPPRAFGRKYAEQWERRFPVVSTCYKNDIVPAWFPWYRTPGKVLQIGKRTNGWSIKDHKDSTEKEELIYEGIDRACCNGS